MHVLLFVWKSQKEQLAIRQGIYIPKNQQLNIPKMMGLGKPVDNPA